MFCQTDYISWPPRSSARNPVGDNWVYGFSAVFWGVATCQLVAFATGGIGNLGPAAHKFVEFLAAAKQHVWQVLPLCPTGFGNSPYAGTSAFAGNPLLISLEVLADWGWIDGNRITGLAGASGNVNFDEVEQQKLPLL